MYEFEGYGYLKEAPEDEEEIKVTVVIDSYSLAEKPTFFDPGNDPEIEISIYDEEGNEVSDLITHESFDGLLDTAWDRLYSHLEDRF